MKEGLRFNEGKNRYDLVHPWAYEQMVNVLTKGSIKYAERNWELGMAWSKIISSLKRHLAAIEKGEDYDLETGELHAAHLACNAHFLTAYYKLYPQGDDRPHTYLRRPKIGLDIDEVCCDWLGGWIEKRGFKEMPHSWLFDRHITEEFDKMEKEGTLEEFMLTLRPLIDPKDLPFEPHCYITARRIDNSISEKWLDVHGFPTAPVYTTPPGSSKIELVKQSGVEWFVDDNYKNFVELNNAGICCYLMDAKHNQRYDVGYKRIKSLKELIC